MSQLEQNKCKCACHDNILRRPYEHSTKCCESMNGEVVPDVDPTEQNKEDWKETLSKILLKHLSHWNMKTAVLFNRPVDEFSEYPYPEFYEITSFISRLLSQTREEIKEKIEKLPRYDVYDGGEAKCEDGDYIRANDLLALFPSQEDNKEDLSAKE